MEIAFDCIAVIVDYFSEMHAVSFCKFKCDLRNRTLARSVKRRKLFYGIDIRILRTQIAVEIYLVFAHYIVYRTKSQYKLTFKHFGY